MNCKKGFATAFRWIATGIKIAAALAVLAVAGLGGGCVILLMVAMVVGVAMHAWTYFSDVAKAMLCTAVALGMIQAVMGGLIGGYTLFGLIFTLVNGR